MRPPVTPAADGSDPYLAWTQATDWQGHSAVNAPGGLASPGSPIPVLIELKSRTDDLARLDIVTNKLVTIPGVYRSAAAWHATRYCTATVTLDRIAALAGHPEVARIEMALPLAAGAVDPGVPGGGLLAGDAAGKVVIGIVDRGCAFLNRVFREGSDEGASRIVALWDQSQGPRGTYWGRPDGVGYGRELLGPTIQTLLGQAPTANDEPRVYRMLDYLLDAGGLVLERAHGTHVADTAAGLVPAKPVAASAKPVVADHAQTCKIIVVNIPALAEGDTTGASSGAFLLDALRYIQNRAGSAARIVINMSVGIHGGPHDGSSLIGLALQEVLEAQQHHMAITVAAGNSALERWSTAGVLGPGEQAERVLRLMPFDRTDSFLEIWWAGDKATDVTKQLAIQVVPPAGLPESEWLVAGQAWRYGEVPGAPAYSVSHLKLSALGDGPMALLSIAPTDGPRGRALPGRWTIRLRNDGPGEVTFDAWVQRDEPPYGTNDPIQPSFDDFADARGGEGCALNDLACGPLVIAVSAARLVDGQESIYAGRAQKGAVSGRQNVRRDADLLALADESAQAIGLFAAGVRSGDVFRMGGTSVAAPVVARKIANSWAAPASRAAAPTGGSVSHDTAKQALVTLLGAPGAGGATTRLPLVRP